jgi:hypothetical protein
VASSPHNDWRRSRRDRTERSSERSRKWKAASERAAKPSGTLCTQRPATRAAMEAAFRRSGEAERTPCPNLRHDSAAMGAAFRRSGEVGHLRNRFAEVTTSRNGGRFRSNDFWADGRTAWSHRQALVSCEFELAGELLQPMLQWSKNSQSPGGWCSRFHWRFRQTSFTKPNLDCGLFGASTIAKCTCFYC